MGKFLTINQGVVLTPVISYVIDELDKRFEAASMHAIVTSGLRDAEKQLGVIREYLTNKGLSSVYPLAMTCKVTDIGADGFYVWQKAWSDLLAHGVIINPPVAAVCLLDSFRVDKSNRKGSLIHETPHSHGTAFNIGGVHALPVIQKAKEDKLPGLVDFLVERENNAIHVDCCSVNSLR